MNFEDIVKQLDRVPEKIRWAVSALFCLLIIVLYYILLRLPAEEELMKLEAERDRLGREYAEKQTIADDLKNWQDQVKQLESQLSEALKQLPEQIAFDDLYRIIPNFAKKNNIELSSFELLDEIPSGDYITVPIELEISGSFVGFARFMQEIGEHPRIMKIEGYEAFRAGKGANDPNSVRVTAQLVTYRFASSAAGQENTSSKRRRKR